MADKPMTRITIVQGFGQTIIYFDIEAVTWGFKESPEMLWLEFENGSRIYIMLNKVVSIKTDSLRTTSQQWRELVTCAHCGGTGMKTA